MSPKTVRILDPTAQSKTRDTGLSPRLDGLGGRSLGIISNAWRSFDAMAGFFQEMATDRYEVREVMRTVNPHLASATPEDTIVELVDRADAAVVGMGH